MDETKAARPHKFLGYQLAVAAFPPQVPAHNQMLDCWIGGLALEATVQDEEEAVADIHITSVTTCCGLALSSSMEKTWAATECSVAKATTAVPALCYGSSPLICLKR